MFASIMFPFEWGSSPDVCRSLMFPFESPDVCRSLMFLFEPPDVCSSIMFLFECPDVFSLIMFPFESPDVCSSIMFPFEPASVPRNCGQPPSFASGWPSNTKFFNVFLQTKLKRFVQGKRAILTFLNFYIGIASSLYGQMRCHIWEVMLSWKSPFKQAGSFHFFFESETFMNKTRIFVPNQHRWF